MSPGHVKLKPQHAPKAPHQDPHFLDSTAARPLRILAEYLHPLVQLKNEGIGDTIRISLTPRPGGDRREEVYAACELLQALGLRSFSPSVTACPGCGRTTSSTFQELAERIQSYIRDMMPIWKTQYEGVETMTLAVMGCIVNGPGESKAANIGISLPGTGEAPRCPVYIDGKKDVTLEGNYDELAAAFQSLVDNYITKTYPRKTAETLAS